MIVEILTYNETKLNTYGDGATRPVCNAEKEDAKTLSEREGKEFIPTDMVRSTSSTDRYHWTMITTREVARSRFWEAGCDVVD